jgi:hypothetical protein
MYTYYSFITLKRLFSFGRVSLTAAAFVKSL